jgi:toxin ParE1/3/4
MARWTSDARRDINEAWLHISENNERAADRIVDAITMAGERLSRFPALGRKGKVPGTREFFVPRTSYFLVYGLLAGNVEIFRVMHTSRQWPPEG